jgi:carotenoid cleavage dioxygenase-like enzyme
VSWYDDLIGVTDRALLRSILAELTAIKETLMTFESVEALVTAINDATNTVAARIDRLIAVIAGMTPGAITQDQLDTLGNQLQAERDALSALGQDQANPIP